MPNWQIFCHDTFLFNTLNNAHGKDQWNCYCEKGKLTLHLNTYFKTSTLCLHIFIFCKLKLKMNGLGPKCLIICIMQKLLWLLNKNTNHIKDDELTTELLHAAKKYRTEDLFAKCKEKLIEIISVENTTLLLFLLLTKLSMTNL